MESQERVIGHCKDFIPQWRPVPNDSFSVSVCASTSNFVYLVSTKAEVHPEKAIYRVFGAAEIVDIEKERELFEKLSGLGFGPQSYGSTGTYRVEEYIPGRPLERLELGERNMIRRICKELKALHSLDLSDFADRNILITRVNAERWRMMGQERLPSLHLSPSDYTEMTALLSESLWETFISILPTTSLVFSHHDCNAQNFLFVQSIDRVRAIDYEYSGYAHRGMDLALTINECMYSYTFPTPPYWSYHPEALFTDELLTMYVREYGGNEELWEETRRCLCVGHYYWALWALVMNKEGGFDYVKYANLRLNDFRREVETIGRMGGVQGVHQRAIEAMQSTSQAELP